MSYVLQQRDVLVIIPNFVPDHWGVLNITDIPAKMSIKRLEKLSDVVTPQHLNIRFGYTHPLMFFFSPVQIGGHALRGLFISTYVLQFSVSVRLSVFGCRAVSNPTPPTQVSDREFITF